ncbi:FtsB family cell division protein [Pectinatus haikarae]|uniref:Cell division protein DivIC n=1 Tax=Pectinatus haikarae TaxID=349096 RepID=A0ABT9Y5H0_9FIRM|nr:septum formation initiator family protein [Pectinatus haikarae]MDQ0202755.1 cell division protein DivIC [Pectinatus haikarae]
MFIFEEVVCIKKRRFDIFVIILFAALGYFIYIAVNQQIYISNIEQERAAIQTRFEEEQTKNKELSEEKQALQDPAYIEKIAREELGMTRKDEIPYVASDK